MTGRPEDQAKTAVEKLLSYEFVCKLKDIPEGSRKCMLLPSNQRSILLINLQNTLYCIDQTCYHHGGPLAHGDIEEMGGKKTIKCPWHAYHIAIATGEGLYMGVDMSMGSNGKLQASSPKVKSKGVKQRTHFVKIENGDVYVADSSLIPGAAQITSDIYAFKHDNELPKSPKKGEIKLHSHMY